PEPDSEDGRLTALDREAVEDLTADLPYRAFSLSDRPSDLLNMLLIGSREQIATAFRAAGWTQASKPSMRTRIRGVTAVIEGLGYRSAPMSPLYLDGEAPGMEWQKGLNDIAKRHHVRLWKQSETWDGREVWAAAATRDVDFAYLRPGSAVTHKIGQNVDEERDKIAYDLEFTSCTDLVDWWERPGDPRFSHNATGDPMSTDGRVAVVRLHDCAAPRTTIPLAGSSPLRAHGNGFQRIARRQILSVRSDFYRKNVYWRSYEGTRWMVAVIRGRHARPEMSLPMRTARTSLFTRLRNSSWLR
ncbi:MAG: LssY C-terminal domain-containing protein, partial [Bryobacteraceae bacterium]